MILSPGIAVLIVVNWFDFDDATLTTSYLDSTLSPEVSYPNPGQWDETTMASGAGSLKLTIPPPGSPADSFVFNFDPVDFSEQFGENTVFYVQWRQRFSDGMLSNNFGGDGFKQAIIGEGDRLPDYVAPGCSEIEVVMYNSYFRCFPQG